MRGKIFQEVDIEQLADDDGMQALLRHLAQAFDLNILGPKVIIGWIVNGDKIVDPNLRAHVKLVLHTYGLVQVGIGF